LFKQIALIRPKGVKKTRTLKTILIFLAILAMTSLVYAQGGGHGGRGGGFHGGYYGGHYYGGGGRFFPRAFWGPRFYFWGWPYYSPYYWGWPYYYPYYWGWPYSYPSYPDYSYSAPSVPPAESEQQQPYYWYFCQDPQGYYPYVKECPGGWMQVVPLTTPPNMNQPNQ
jgi:hypothetical protein